MVGNESLIKTGDSHTISKNILIIEDDEMIRETLKEVLEMEGYAIHCAENGKEGLKILSRIQNIQLILLDLMMPEMNGFEFLDFRLTDTRISQIPVIIVSAFPEQAQKANINVNGFVKKPIDLEHLLSLISEYLK
jgi:CheY-like chemotaxis protein